MVRLVKILNLIRRQGQLQVVHEDQTFSISQVRNAPPRFLEDLSQHKERVSVIMDVLGWIKYCCFCVLVWV